MAEISEALLAAAKDADMCDIFANSFREGHRFLPEYLHIFNTVVDAVRDISKCASWSTPRRQGTSTTIVRAVLSAMLTGKAKKILFLCEDEQMGKTFVASVAELFECTVEDGEHQQTISLKDARVGTLVYVGADDESLYDGVDLVVATLDRDVLANAAVINRCMRTAAYVESVIGTRPVLELTLASLPAWPSKTVANHRWQLAPLAGYTVSSHQ